MNHHLSIEFRIRFNGAWHIGSGDSGIGVNNLIARDPHGIPLLPASSVRGALRESLEDLVGQWGGRVVDPHSVNLYSDNPVHFGHRGASPAEFLFGSRFSGECCFILSKPAGNSDKIPVQVRTSVAMDPFAGSARDHSLRSLETAGSSEWEVRVDCFHDDDLFRKSGFEASAPIPPVYALMAAASMNLSRIGGNRSRGMGSIAITPESLVVGYNGETVAHDTVADCLDSLQLSGTAG